MHAHISTLIICVCVCVCVLSLRPSGFVFGSNGRGTMSRSTKTHCPQKFWHSPATNPRHPSLGQTHRRPGTSRMVIPRVLPHVCLSRQTSRRQLALRTTSKKEKRVEDALATPQWDGTQVRAVATNTCHPKWVRRTSTDTQIGTDSKRKAWRATSARPNRRTTTIAAGWTH